MGNTHWVLESYFYNDTLFNKVCFPKFPLKNVHHHAAVEVEVDDHPSLVHLLLAARHTSASLMMRRTLIMPASHQITMIFGDSGDDDLDTNDYFEYDA